MADFFFCLVVWLSVGSEAVNQTSLNVKVKYVKIEANVFRDSPDAVRIRPLNFFWKMGVARIT